MNANNHGFENEQIAIDTRNAVVKEWDSAKLHLRNKRAEGISLTETEWELWDAIDAQYGKIVAEIDHVIYKSGWMY